MPSAVGQTPVLWTLPHDWSAPVAESLAWRTDVLPRADGGEQRAAVRYDSPVRTLTYRLLLGDAGENGRITRLLMQATERRVSLPLWMDAARLVDPLAPGDVTVNTDTTGGRSYVAGGSVLLWRDGGPTTGGPITEVVTLQSLTGTALTFAGPGVVSAWPAGATWVAPLVTARLVTPVARDFYAGAVSEAPTVAFVVEDAAGQAGVDAGAAFGDGATGVPVQLWIYPTLYDGATSGGFTSEPGPAVGWVSFVNYTAALRAVAVDAMGVAVPGVGGTVAWSTSDASALPVHATPAAGEAVVKKASGGSATVTATLTLPGGAGTLTATFST